MSNGSLFLSLTLNITIGKFESTFEYYVSPVWSKQISNKALFNLKLCKTIVKKKSKLYEYASGR